MGHVVEALSVFFLGAIILAPVAALSARFAMKPLIALFSRRIVGDQLTAQVTEQARRIDLLESELAATQEAVKALTVATEFEHQLAPAAGSSLKSGA